MAYPTSVATDADLYLVKNQLSTVLNGSLDGSQTTVTVTSTAGFPTVGVITVDSEVIKYTSINATQFLGCTRGFDGTGATTHSSGATVKHAVTAIHHNALKDELIAVETNNMPGQRKGGDGSVAVSAGNIGETLTATFAAVSLTTSTSNPVNLPITAGVWLIIGHLNFNVGAATPSYVQMSVTTSSATNHTGSTEGLSRTWGNLYSSGSTNGEGNVIFPYRSGSSATLYMHADVGAGSYQAYGSIVAVRIA